MLEDVGQEEDKNSYRARKSVLDKEKAVSEGVRCAFFASSAHQVEELYPKLAQVCLEI